MSLKFLEENMLGASEIFTIKREDTKAIIFTTRKMSELEQYGIELHYEVHYSEGKSNFVRLDCHVAPYSVYKNCTKEEFIQRVFDNYSTEQGNKILKFRKELKDTFLQIGKASMHDKLFYGKSNKYNYWYLATMDLPTRCSNDQLRESVEFFINQTRANLENALNTLVSILQ